jgi:hypothetical protein
MICRSTIYAAFGIFAVLALALQTASMYFTKISAIQFVMVQAAFYITYIASLPLWFNGFTDLCVAP